MHTINLTIEDKIYEHIVKSGINVQEELKKSLYKMLYNKENQIADDINQALLDVEKRNTKPLNKLLDEL